MASAESAGKRRRRLRWPAMRSGVSLPAVIRQLFLGRIVYIYICLVIIPAMMLIGFMYQKSNAVIQTEVARAMLQSLKQADINLSNRLNGVRTASNMLFLNNGIRVYMSARDAQTSYFEKRRVVYDVRDSFANALVNENISRIMLYTADPELTDSDRSMLGALSDVQGYSWYETVAEKGGDIHWLSPYEHVSANSANPAAAGPVMSCLRAIRDSSDWNRIGALLSLDVKEATIFDTIADIDLSPNQNIFIVDQSGRIISHRDTGLIGQSTDIFPAIQSAATQAQLDGIINETPSPFITLYRQNTITGWWIIAEIPRQEFLHRNDMISSVYSVGMVVITLLVISFAILLIYFQTNKRIVQRINRITRQVQAAGPNIQSLDSVIDRNDPGMIDESIETIVRTVHSLVEDSYAAKLAERNAQLHLLQAQINPHFLYNTLDTIKWLALENNLPDTIFMLNALSKYFRLNLKKGSSTLTIGQELELIRHYFTIQNIRFSNSIQLTENVDESCLEYILPKMTLQPIIENAIMHGIQRKAGRNGRIVISAWINDDDICFSIVDDGVGMDEETVARLLANPTDSEKRGFGLYNVNQRIKLFFGTQYGISIMSSPGNGTCVTVRIGKRSGAAPEAGS